MWFRNLQIYRLRDCRVTAAQLEDALARQAFQGCGNMEMLSRGWVAPRGAGDALVFSLQGQMLIALGVEQRLLPASVVNQYAQERAAEIEEQQGFRPGRKQLREIKEQVADELLPRAFTRRRTTFAWIDPAGGWFAIDAANPAKADELLETLRKSVDDLSLSLIKTEVSPATAMTGWLAANEAPAGFSIDRDCELRAPGEEKSTVRYVRHPLESDEIRRHIEAGKQVTRLALTWNDRISFVLQENLQVKRLAFLDLLKDEAEQQAETADEMFDADFAIMAGELARFLPDLIEALGGEGQS
ncbi:MAG: recombination-associated protein RdgC [Sulfuricella sp.]|nr:recombination-associated protein RdgC [Sulfuricella sp.]